MNRKHLQVPAVQNYEILLKLLSSHFENKMGHLENNNQEII